MVDYAKKTVVELQEILKSRGLPHSGKKAELVARLNEADVAAEAQETAKAPPAESTTAPPIQAPEPASKPVPQPPAPTVPAPVDEAKESAASPSANTDTALADSASYALNLPVSDVDSEMAKRKARAERFGISAAGSSGPSEADIEAQKALERAKRFGTGQTTMGKLDEALPTERERGARKRARPDEGGALDDPALRKGARGTGRGGPHDARPHGSGRNLAKPAGVAKVGGAFSSESDRLAAEARKKRFTAAT